jgi:DNA-binding MarR family transcriptional regulator
MPTMPARTSKALQAWQDLNDRQQGTLAVIYDLDQAAEAGRKRGAARGEYDDRPADAWRSIDFAHEPAMRSVFGWTVLQERLMWRGWDNQGNGSTMAALARRGLITRDGRPTQFGRMHTVRLTREGRAAARAGTSLNPSGPRKAALGQRSWEVLALLWSAHLRGEPLKWGYSTTIERALIDKHVPPLARHRDDYSGYEITDRGREFYREHYAAHAAAHPDVRAPHPDGTDAEPWPPEADSTLAQHRQLYCGLLAVWKDACTARQAAEQEAAAPLPKTPAGLPAAAVAQAKERHDLWCDTARQRAALAAEHAEDLRARAEHAARSYAITALTVYRAAVTQADPLDGLTPPAPDPDTWDEPPLPAPPETGIHAIDAEATKLHAAAVGKPLKRRGPAPTRRTRRGNVRLTEKPFPEPGAALYALAEHLRGHVQAGALVRRLHPTD